MTKGAWFWNFISKKYAKDPISDLEGYQRTLNASRRYLNPEDNVLEFGCGTGTTALELSDSKAKILATDFSSGMISIAEGKRKEKKIANVTFMQAEIFDERLKNGSFDVVMGFNILHLVENIDEILERVENLLKPKGIFISKTPCLGKIRFHWKVLAFLFKVMRMIPYIKFYTAKNLQEIIELAGFQTIEKEVQSNNLPRLFIVSKKVSTQ